MDGTAALVQAKYLFHLENVRMLHDQMMARTGEGDLDATAIADRRSSDRVPFPAELVLAWNHNQGVPVRYRVLDAGDGGYRIRSSVPMLEGTTGMVVRLLPGRGKQVGQPVMVAWSRADDDERGYEIGVRCF